MIFGTTGCTCGWRRTYAGDRPGWDALLAAPCGSCGAAPCGECEGVRHAEGEHVDPRTGEPRG